MLTSKVVVTVDLLARLSLILEDQDKMVLAPELGATAHSNGVWLVTVHYPGLISGVGLKGDSLFSSMRYYKYYRSFLSI